MKKVYIPHGETVNHDNLYTGRIVVKGVLRVNGKISAKQIVGGGIVEAHEIVCDDIRADNIVADYITARRIAANKLFVHYECRASQAVAVRDYAAAGYMNTGKLSMTLSDIQACDADEVIVTKQKRSLIGLLWVSWWRSLFLNLFHGNKEEAHSDEAEPEETLQEESTEPAPTDGVEAITAPQDTTDIDMLICLLTEMRKLGFIVSKANSASAGEEDAA
jgi:hypothetical protein